MRFRKLAVISLMVGVVSAALACSTTPDASDAEATDERCCPPSPSPGCCMSYGGWNEIGTCGRTCDGMPVSSDPGWTLATDDHGCKVWRNPSDYFHGGTANPSTHYCGRRDVGELEEAGAGRCPDPTAIDATTFPYAPALAAPGACTPGEAKALVDFVAARDSFPPISEWSKEVSAQCSACVFSEDGERWAPIVVAQDQAVHVNRGGCIELQTGNESCGRAYEQLMSCRERACSDCSLLPDRLACMEDTAPLDEGPCKTALDTVTATCGDALQAAQEACRGAALAFEGPIRVQCVTGATMAGAGDGG